MIPYGRLKNLMDEDGTITEMFHDNILKNDWLKHLN